MKFEISLEGANVGLGIEGDPPGRKYGFYTTRWVEAPDEDTARDMVLSMVRLELSGKIGDPFGCELLSVKITEICELETFVGVDAPGQGFTFFPADDN